MSLKIIDTETAKLLNEVIDEDLAVDVIGVRYSDGVYDHEEMYFGFYNKERFRNSVFPAPNQELARKFIRDNYNIDINIPSNQDSDGIKEYYLEIRDWDNAPEDSDLRIFDIFNSYEEALEIALKRALDYILTNNK